MTRNFYDAAFPTNGWTEEDGTIVEGETGMTIRDYFAGQALAGGLEQGVEDNFGGSWWHQPSRIAARAYAIADAMLEASQK